MSHTRLTDAEIRQWARTRPPAIPQTMWEIGYRDQLARASTEELRETISNGWTSRSHAILAAWASEELKSRRKAQTEEAA